MESNSVCNHMSDEEGPICLITSMIPGRIGLHSVLLPVNHNYHNNKILKSGWLSTVLISALIGQCNRTDRVIPEGLFTIGGVGQQIGEITSGGSSHLSCKHDQIKMRH